LISKQQLQKLNKKTKENTEEMKLKEIKIYKERVKTLFNDLLDNNPPDDLLYYVKSSFDSFLDKSIYYFKAHDNIDFLEKERCEDIHDDIDYEKEEREIENGNYTEQYIKEDDEEEEEEEDDEENNEEDDEEEEEDDDEEEDDEEDKIDTTITNNAIIVKGKYNKPSKSIGVDDIQKLPLNWFQNVRQNYTKNKIIPRKKSNDNC
jgi:hypothetical protein